MLDLKVSIENDKVVINGLEEVAQELPNAVRRGLHRIGGGIYQEAFHWLSGPGAKKSNIPGGGYPVPVRTGHLRRMLDWLAPGESKTGDAGTFSAGGGEAVIFDSASYAPAVFLGLGSSKSYGPRDALRDALYIFEHGGNIERVMDEEIRRAINKRGSGT